jgi:hypothetical protein
MNDICIWSGTDCPQKEKCYRFTAKADEYQAYFLIPPVDKDGKCDHYWGEKSESIWKQLKDIVNGK